MCDQSDVAAEFLKMDIFSSQLSSIFSLVLLGRHALGLIAHTVPVYNHIRLFLLGMSLIIPYIMAKSQFWKGQTSGTDSVPIRLFIVMDGDDDFKRRTELINCVSSAQGPFAINVRQRFRCLRLFYHPPLERKCPHENATEIESLGCF